MIDEKTVLPRYFDILEKNKTAQYLQSKYTPVSFDIAESTEKLWEKHDIIKKHLLQSHLKHFSI